MHRCFVKLWRPMPSKIDLVSVGMPNTILTNTRRTPKERSVGVYNLD